ncbi:MAG: elongation factor P maturation arginine rhamnosyltransferase EarP [Bdellovibrionales bacterium]|nr:elongation factor P maturation arginine rhamnosyltransferase EarP [Massilia sp.]
MLPELATPATLAIFCKVVDNYGDIGICWRLARQLASEHSLAVTLWVDDLASFRRICPAIDVDAAMQQMVGVCVRHWRGQDDRFVAADVADIVIEFFAVDIPPGYIEAMAQRTPRPVWLNLEGLSAEAWVEGCHSLPSMHPRLPLTKYFFFPGFTANTGGLLREAGLDAQRRRFQSDPNAVAQFLARLGVPASEISSLKVSLFCYPDAPLGGLFAAWRDGAEALTCLVPEGVAQQAVEAFLGVPAAPGAAATHGALTLRVLPFVPQPDYDRLLWACDLNIVRGEDSFVRAQWAGRGFIWHIYRQDENLHHVKLQAFLERYAEGLASLKEVSLRWNGACAPAGEGAADWPSLWRALRAEMPAIAARAEAWQATMEAHGDLAGNLLQFCRQLTVVTHEN